ncbi:MAG TPA: hypothetical protein VMH83_00915 [Candidatus Acidoferrum sp.]|nr:hypothetical protein [Candidatus Acidoferrum sp.]
MVPSNFLLPRLTTSLRIVIVLAATLAQSALAGGNIYKYVNNEGRTVLSATIPAEYVKSGYTILNDKGQVIQVVKPAATEAELAKVQAERDAEKKALADKVAQEENDKLLIRLYRGPEEIAKKRDAAIGTLKTQQDLVKLNLAKAEEDIGKLQTVVDNTTKAGKDVPADTAKKLAAAQANKDKNVNQLKKMDEDRAKLIADAERDYKRLRELMSLPAEAIPAPPEAVTADKSANKPADKPADKPSAEKPATK